MNRRRFLNSLGAVGLSAFASPQVGATAPRRRPNLVVILTDDMGYGDIGCFGNSKIRTPSLDRMAAGGMLLTDFYAAANLCTPSRAGLLTGRYPIRTGLARGVITQKDTRGLPLSEVTIAEALKPDYATALIGKWHLGHLAPTWPPTRQGFDYFYGIPYSHDMTPLSLFEARAGAGIVAQTDVDYPQLQQDFYARAERFITANRSRPFFLELALSAPHLPNFPDPAHEGKSAAGEFGDSVEEIDSIVGRLTRLLDQLGLTRDTVVLFTSDNGPWFEGSAGSLRGRKGGGGYDGASRVPFIASWPGAIAPGSRSNAIANGIDILPTLCAMAGRPLPAGVTIDGKDLSGVLLRGEPTPHDQLIFFNNEDVVALRTQRWKYVAADYLQGTLRTLEGRGYPQLYDMADDGSEVYSVASRHPDVLHDMESRLHAARAEFASLRTTPGSGIFTPPVKNVVPAIYRDD